jgi:hypothetical protein
MPVTGEFSQERNPTDLAQAGGSPWSGVALWGRQHQRAVDAACREALTNPNMARTMSSALGPKQPMPMQVGKMHAF